MARYYAVHKNYQGKKSGIDAASKLKHGSNLKSSTIVGITAVLCYANSLFGEFVYDDYEVIETNLDLRPKTLVSSLFFNDFWGVPLRSNKSHQSYRPISILTFRWNFFVGGLNPIGYHTVNIIFHGFASVLFFRLCTRLFNGLQNSATNSLPLLCGMFFAVHPIHTEAVADSVGRADILCGSFFLLSFLSYMNGFTEFEGTSTATGNPPSKYSRFWLASCVLWCVLALFSKEQGITVLGVVAVYDLIYVCNLTVEDFLGAVINPSKLLRPWPKWALRLAERLFIITFTAATLLYFRIAVISGGLGHSFSESDNPSLFHPDFLTRLRTYSYLCAFNAWLLLCPSTLCFDWSMDSISRIESWLDMRNVVTLGFGVVLVCMSIYGLTTSRKCWEFFRFDANRKLLPEDNIYSNDLRQDHSGGRLRAVLVCPFHSRKRLVSLALSLIVIPFLPASNLFVPVGFVIAERVLYIPSMGLCILTALGVSVLLRRHSTAINDSDQNTMPRKSIDWSFGLNKFGNFLVWSLLLIFIAKTVHRNIDWKDEESLSRSGLKINPTNAKIHLAMGNALAKKGKLSCEKHYREALRLRPHYVMAWENLGLVLLNSGRAQEAEECYMKALSIKPNSPEGNTNLAHLLRVTGRFEEADIQYKKALKLRPNHPRLKHFHGVVLENLGRRKEAEECYIKATTILPNDPLSFQSLGKMLATALLKETPKQRTNKITKKAEDYLRRAVTLKPSDLETRLLLAELYLKNGNMDLARLEANYVLKNDPYNKQAEYLLDRVFEYSGLLKDAKQLYYGVLKKDFMQDDAEARLQRINEKFPRTS